MKGLIFGAKSVAIGVCRALKELWPEIRIFGFLVSSLENNPKELEGMPVWELAEASAKLTDEEKRKICVYIAVPEILQGQIRESLLRYGFVNYKTVDSRTEADWMERYYAKISRFPSIHALPIGKKAAALSVYAAQFCRDKKLAHPPEFPPYVSTLLLGCAGNPDKERERRADFCDHTGGQISAKNPDYCEMTAFYWIWKNRLTYIEDYVGVYHYRRMLDLTEDDRKRLLENRVDAVLPYPMIHLPDIREHHGRYMAEDEWQVMLMALKQLYPAYAERYEEIFAGIYLYNYNLILAKKEVFADYCAWVFPLLFKTEELCAQKGVKRTGRSLAYMSESLLSLYFLYHEEWNIYHAGRLLFT